MRKFCDYFKVLAEEERYMLLRAVVFQDHMGE